MDKTGGTTRGALRTGLRLVLTGPQMLAFLPAITLGAFWLGGEAALLGVALAMPALFAFAGLFGVLRDFPMTAELPNDPTDDHGDLELRLDALIRRAPRGHGVVCMIMALDDADPLQTRLGHRATEDLMSRVIERVAGVLRTSDHVVRLDGLSLGICAPLRRSDLESGIRMATRLQTAIEEPFSVDAAAIYVSASIGFCLASRLPEPSGEALLDAAAVALTSARVHGPGSIRAYSTDMGAQMRAGNELIAQVGRALDEGQVQAWFQPQVSTDTGQITGFEALARWVHPQRGVMPPAEFLPAIEAGGRLDRLGELMLHAALQALVAWDKAGLSVPAVSVNLSATELRNPRLPDKVKWELDRFEIAPGRLCIEVLETVVAHAEDDVLTRNVAALAAMGCRIDLDDFGTGHASIASIRRFAVRRLKIDRTFVTRIDEDPEQKRMVAAIVTMAERLGLDTVAEGVETIGEHATLAQLGCGHVQGFGLGRPMPFDETQRWIAAHRARVADVPRIGQRSA